MATLEEFIAYAKLTPDDDQTDAQLCFEAALQAAEDIGIRPERMYGNRKFDYYVYSLALHYLDNKGFQPISQAYAVDEYTRRVQTKMGKELYYSTQNRGGE